MELRPLGASGLRVSLVGLGCNNFGGRIDLAATRKVIDAAIAAGINHFDTADVYGGNGKSEEFIGQILDARRKDIVLATKLGKMDEAVPGVRGSRAYIASAVEASLRRLRTEWIDLLYMHEPDPQTPIAETLRALDELIRAGKVRAIAASNYSAEEVSEAADAAKQLGVTGFVATQDEYSLINRDVEKTLLPVLEKRGLALIPYFPLGGGALSGKYRKGKPLPEGARHTKAQGGLDRFVAPNWDLIEKLHAFAEQRGRSLLELAMSWLARRPQVTSIIAGATRPEQIDANVKATGWALTPAEMAEVEKITAVKLDLRRAPFEARRYARAPQERARDSADAELSSSNPQLFMLRCSPRQRRASKHARNVSPSPARRRSRRRSSPRSACRATMWPGTRVRTPLERIAGL